MKTNHTKDNDCPYCNIDLPLTADKDRQIFEWHLNGHQTNHTKNEQSEVRGVVEEEYTSHEALKEWETEKDQNTLSQNIVALLGIHGMHCKFYEYQDASHITKAFESLFTHLQEQHEAEKRELVEEIISNADLTPYAEEHNGELVDCSFYQIYKGKIEEIAVRHGLSTKE